MRASLFRTRLVVASVLVAQCGHAQAQDPPIDATVRCRDTVIVSNYNRENYGNQISGDVILEWDFEEGGDWTISTCSENTDYDSWLNLYSDPGLTNVIMLNDDADCGINGSYAILRGNIAAGLYYIVIEGFANNVGQAEVSITCDLDSRTRECGDCGGTQEVGEVGCEYEEIEDYVCGLDHYCCDTHWDHNCPGTIEAGPNPFSCADEPPPCQGNPDVGINTKELTLCDGTPSGADCVEEAQCVNATFDRRGHAFAQCYRGGWVAVPGCINPNAGPFGHLWFTTLDSLTFTYHKTGVIRLWESPANDMELQIRTLRPAGVSCDASLIGQVALRAGNQLITAVGSRDNFEVRYNGVLQDNAQSDEVTLGSGPDELLLNLSPTVLSISSKRGALIQIFFYLEPNMSWLTVPQSLDPRTFYGTTRGLLGVFDGDASNDFTTRDGVQLPVVPYNNEEHYGDQLEFGNSWVVSDSESLFGAAEDAIAAADSQYEGNPVGSPAISCPLEFPNASVPECDARDPAHRAACYFDVVLGGPQFLKDVAYQDACGSNGNQYCNFHGTCVNNACFCNDGWSGDDCSERICPPTCLGAGADFVDPNQPCDLQTGHCNCRAGFTGPTCEEVADCSEVDNCNALRGQGFCVDHNLCQCTSLVYSLPNCTYAPVIRTSSTSVPTTEPTNDPTSTPTNAPTPTSTNSPTSTPTNVPTDVPTNVPTPSPTANPSPSPTAGPTTEPTAEPTLTPTDVPSPVPTDSPTAEPTAEPTLTPTDVPTPVPTNSPTAEPTAEPTLMPTDVPTPVLTNSPTAEPTAEPTLMPTDLPTTEPTAEPSPTPTDVPTPVPTNSPTVEPTGVPTPVPTDAPAVILPGRTAVPQCSSSLMNSTTCLVNLYYDTAAVKCCRDVVSWRVGPHVECSSQSRKSHSGRSDSDRCFPAAATFAQASDFCSAMRTEGDSDWRLCTSEEIVEECCEESGDVECHGGLDVWSSSVCEGVAPPSDCQCAAEITAAKPNVIADILGRLNSSLSGLVQAEIQRQTREGRN